MFDTDDHEYGLNFKFESKNNFFEDFSTPKFFDFFSIFFAKIWLKFEVSDSSNHVFQVFWASNVSK